MNHVSEGTCVNSAPGPAAENFDELTIEELASLFKNFKNLEKPIQNSLIDYMKNLEKSNPAKVTDLKKKIHSWTEKRGSASRH